QPDRSTIGEVSLSPQKSTASDGRAAAVWSFMRRARSSSGDEPLELQDRVLLLLDHRAYTVANRDHANHPLGVDDRQVPDPALGHDLHAALDRLGRARPHRPRGAGPGN